MKRTVINLQFGGNPEPIFAPFPAYESNAPGLVVHRRHWADGGDRYWVITHAHSGTRIGCDAYDTRKRAIEATARLAPLADWTKAHTDLSNVPDLFERMQAALYQ
jgi:hypothetical protein